MTRQETQAALAAAEQKLHHTYYLRGGSAKRIKAAAEVARLRRLLTTK